MKSIPNFPDYSITQDGRVWSNRRRIWLRPVIRNNYLAVTFSVSSQRSTHNINRLVLETYVGPCPAGMETRHLNGIHTDNRLINLCWGTRNENRQDSTRLGASRGPKGEKHGASKLTEAKVKAIYYLRNIAKFTLADLAWQFDVSPSNIWNICRGITWKHLYAKV